MSTPVVIGKPSFAFAHMPDEDYNDIAQRAFKVHLGHYGDIRAEMVAVWTRGYEAALAEVLKGR